MNSKNLFPININFLVYSLGTFKEKYEMHEENIYHLDVVNFNIL